MKRQYIIITFLVLAIVFAYFVLSNGSKIPPTYIKSTDISSILSITNTNNETYKLNETDIEFWNGLEFEITRENYPGETPDKILKLNSSKNSFSAIYNKYDRYIYFSFYPEIKYGFLNSPPEGGWTQPLYKTKVSIRLLEFLKINRFEFDFISYNKSFEILVTDFYKNTFSCASEVVPYALIIGMPDSENLPEKISVLSYCEEEVFSIGNKLLIKPESEPSILNSPNPLNLIYFAKDTIINGELKDWVIGSEHKAIWGKPIQITNELIEKFHK